MRIVKHVTKFQTFRNKMSAQRTKKEAKKMTQTDYKIELLERIGPEISDVEINQLNSLKERKSLMAKLGIENKATIVPKFPPRVFNKSNTGLKSKSNSGHLHISMDDQDEILSLSDEVQVGKLSEEEPPKIAVKMIGQVKKLKKKSGQGFASPFLQFVKKCRVELDKVNPGASLNKKTMREKWIKMDEEEKKEFYDKALSEKERLGINFRKDIKDNSLSEIEKQSRKAESNKRYREKLKEEKAQKTHDKGTFEDQMNEVIAAKQTKLSDMINYVEILNAEVVKTKQLNREASQSLTEQEVEFLVIKEQYKSLHKTHKNCDQ